MLVLYGASGSPSAAAERVTALAVLAGLFRLRTVHLCAPSRCERRADRLVELLVRRLRASQAAVAQRVVGVKCQKQVAVASVGYAVQREDCVRKRAAQ